MPVQHFLTNLSGKVRYESMEDRDYIVAPMVMMTEGVHIGNNGPVLYSAEELSKVPHAWNHKPIVVYHPQINGQGVSACDATILNSRKLGLIMNTEWTSPKLKSEAWLEASRVPKVDKRVMETLESGNLMEVSVGVFADYEEADGDWNGEAYKGIAHNLRGDHLALLPDRKGACSIADGAGLLQNARQLVHKMRSSGLLLCNEVDHEDIRKQLWDLIRNEVSDDAWIEEMFDQYFVYSSIDKLYKLGYTKGDSGIVLGKTPAIEVKRDVQFNPVNNEEEKMDKKKFVDGLISNTQTKWEEKDRDFLMGLEEPVLLKFEPAPIENKKPEEKPEAKPEAKPEEKPAPTTNEEKPEAKAVTEEEYIQNAPDAIREMLSEGLSIRNDHKKGLVKTILENKANRFTEDQLTKKPLGELQAIAELAGAGSSSEEGSSNSYPSYVGAAGSHFQNERHEDHKETPYELPTINWADAG